MKNKRRRPLSSKSYLVAILSFLFLLDVFALLSVAKRDYDETIDRARIVLEKTCVSLEERVKRSVVATEAILQNRVLRIQEVGVDKMVSSTTEWERFCRAADSLPDAGSLWLLDDKADLLLDSMQRPSPRANFADREYFVPHRDKRVQLYIGPVVKGRITNKYSFTVSQRIDGKDGSFFGIIVAAIDTEDFTHFLRSIDIGKGSTVTVFRTDGALVLRQPMRDEYLGKTFSHLKLFGIPFDRSPSGTFESSAMDGTTRLLSYRKISGLPLLVTTGVPLDSVIAEWRTRAKIYTLAAAFFCAALIGLSLLVHKTTSKEEKDRAKELSEINQSLHTQIAERRAVEESLRQVHDQLEARVRERTGELAHINEALNLEIAERRRAEEAAKTEHQRLDDVLEMLPVYVILLTPDYHIPFANRFFVERFGESHGRRCFEYLFGRTTPCETCNTYAVLKTGTSYRWDWTGPDGRIYDVHDFPFSDTDGSPLIMEVGIDITERKQAEEAVGRAMAYNRSLIEASLDPLVTISPEGKISDVNTATEEVTGCARDALIGKDFSDYFTEPEKARAGYQMVFSEGSVRDYPLEIRNRNGHITKVLYNASVYRDETGKVIGVFAAARDISERQRLEAQLRQAQKMEALGTLSGGIAHDFNNILAAILGFAEITKDHMPKGSKDERHLQRVMEAGLRGRELVRQMLTFSRRTEQEKKPLELSSIVKESAKLLRASTPATISIRVDAPSESGLVLGDPTQIHQIIMNLSTNAVHSMREKGGILDIELNDIHVTLSDGNESDVKPGAYVVLKIRDTGIGISSDIMDRIFDPFFTTKKLGEGTGLGLSVVHGIVKQSNGHITVESDPGMGSTFTVYFPKITGAVKSEERSEESVPSGDERILFIDDEEAIVEMGSEFLSELGYRVTSLTSSVEALRLVREDASRFDLIITDQTMPDITGLDLATEILSLRPEMPIIMCTGFSEVVSADIALGAGIKAFVMKPLTKKEIAKSIRQVLDE